MHNKAFLPNWHGLIAAQPTNVSVSMTQQYVGGHKVDMTISGYGAQ